MRIELEKDLGGDPGLILPQSQYYKYWGQKLENVQVFESISDRNRKTIAFSGFIVDKHRV